MRWLLILFPLFIFQFCCFGQTDRDIGNSMAKINQQQFDQGVKRIDKKQIEGSPYLDKEFKPALIIKTDHSEIRNMALRYNAYENTMEFKQKETVLFIVDPVTISEIIFEDRTFVYAMYKAAGKTRLSYFQLLTEGKYQLLKKYNIAFKGPESKSDTPAQFISQQPAYYLRYKSGMAHLISSRKKMIRALQPISNEMVDFIQQERINVRNEPELINALKFINQSDK
jgi:hypothetical protein